jgi:hypothetical protein
MKSMKPTVEQEKAIELFKTGKSLKINAFAGSGKTATLQFLSDISLKAGLYLAFNRTLAEEAKSKFRIKCKTCHSLAFQATPRVLKKNRIKMFGVFNTNKIAKILALKKVTLNSNLELSSGFCAALIKETLRKFLLSDDDEIGNNHVPVIGKLKTLSSDYVESIKKDIVENTNILWERMIDPDDDSVPLGHDGYFKLWALSNPTLPFEFILLDEAQDTAPVMLGILKKQKCQVVLVGDKYQQIYEWRGAVNAMELFKTENETTLTQSFRFGEAIADAATKLLCSLGEESTLIGNPEINSKIGCINPDVILCRTNASVIDYTIKCLDSDLIPHILGGNGDILKLLTAVEKLKLGETTNIPEFFGFTTWSEIVSFSQSEEGANLKTLVKIVERYGEDYLLNALSKTHSSEREAELTISTVHRAKGRQWNNVVIIDDFGITHEKEDDSRTEKYLLYVALTRAREEVQIPYSIASMLGIKNCNTVNAG